MNFHDENGPYIVTRNQVRLALAIINGLREWTDLSGEDRMMLGYEWNDQRKPWSKKEILDTCEIMVQQYRARHLQGITAATNIVRGIVTNHHQVLPSEWVLLGFNIENGLPTEDTNPWTDVINMAAFHLQGLAIETIMQRTAMPFKEGLNVGNR